MTSWWFSSSRAFDGKGMEKMGCLFLEICDDDKGEEGDYEKVKVTC